MGSVQPLQGGNELVGWGSAPYFSEYNSSGRMLMDAVFPGHDLSYRAHARAVGRPAAVPAGGAARRHGGKTVVYASWNGATQVASWRVLGGSPLRPVASAAKAGFETAIPVPGSYQNFEVQGLDSRGRVVGSSRPFSVG